MRAILIATLLENRMLNGHLSEFSYCRWYGGSIALTAHLSLAWTRSRSVFLPLPVVKCGWCA